MLKQNIFLRFNSKFTFKDNIKCKKAFILEKKNEYIEVKKLLIVLL